MTNAVLSAHPAPALPAATADPRAARLPSSPWRLLRLLVLLPALLVAATYRSRLAPAPVWSDRDPLFTEAPTVDLSVVIPCYNAGDALRPTVQRLLEVATDEGLAVEAIVVSDGSTDGCEASVDGIDPRVRVVRCPVNRGKGAALHRGFALARGRFVGFVDADGDIDPAHVVAYYRRAEAGGHDVVFASKRHPESRSASSPVRKVISYGFIALVGALFALGVSDTQTGCKVFRREVVAQVLPRLREQRFAFDLEFFVAARAAGIQRMAAAPVEIRTRMAGSSVGRSAITRTLSDALTVLARLHFTPTYRDATVPSGPAAPPPAAVVPLPRRGAEPVPSVPTLKAA